jgi:hypothetical protein
MTWYGEPLAGLQAAELVDAPCAKAGTANRPAVAPAIERRANDCRIDAVHARIGNGTMWVLAEKNLEVDMRCPVKSKRMC